MLKPDMTKPTGNRIDPMKHPYHKIWEVFLRSLSNNESHFKETKTMKYEISTQQLSTV